VSPKSLKTAISEEHSPFGRKYRENHRPHHCVAGACDGHRDGNDCLRTEGTDSTGLRRSELLTRRPAHVVVGDARALTPRRQFLKRRVRGTDGLRIAVAGGYFRDGVPTEAAAAVVKVGAARCTNEPMTLANLCSRSHRACVHEVQSHWRRRQAPIWKERGR
jgi:hypothetical protein